MGTALTYAFVVISCLLLGGLVGSEIGRFGKARIEAQRDKSLRLAGECGDLLDRAEKAAMECSGQMATLRTIGNTCCDAARRALDERDACRRGHGGKR